MAMAMAPVGGEQEERSIEVCGLQFCYPDQPLPFISIFNLHLNPGSRCLLIGANGCGKTTLLRILAGKHMVGGSDVVKVLGRSAFHDTSLICDGDLAYLGGSWSKTVGCAGEIPLQGDFSAEHMIFGVEGADPVRREELIDLLDIDLEWRMHKVSDGQRRRVQICMGLLQSYKVLLLDEITVDLDVVARMDLLSFFARECEQRGVTIIYATHIFDGLEEWASHVAYVEDGKLKKFSRTLDIPEFKSRGPTKKLLQVVETWLRNEREQKTLNLTLETKPPIKRVSSPWASSRHMAYYR